MRGGAAALLLGAALVAACGSNDAGTPGPDDAGPLVQTGPPPKTSKPTRVAAEALKKLREPRAVLFFPPGPVADQVFGYLADLGQESGVLFEVREIDRLIQVEEAKRFRVERDGVVVLVSGESSESIELHPDGAAAAADLAVLDARIARALTRLGRGIRQVALIRHRVADVERFQTFQEGLAALGFKVVTVVPGKDVPPGALAIFLDVGAGPTRPAMESIDRHLAAGGAALVAIGVRRGASLGPLEARLGLRLVPGRRKVASARLTAHPSTTLASRTGAVQLAATGALQEIGAPPRGSSRVVTIREATAPERPIAAAIETGTARAIVVADASWLSDDVVRVAPADLTLLFDSVHWLIGEEELEAVGIDQPATGDNLTTYTLRTAAVAGGRNALWKAAADGVRGVTFETRGRLVVLERRDDGLWGRVERPSPDGTGASVREFPLAPEGKDLFAALAEPVPLRAVGPLDPTTRARYGLDDGTLTVDVGSASHTLMVGSRVMAGNDRYAAERRARAVVILPAAMMDPLDQPERLALRRLVDLDEKAVSRLVAARGDRSREAERDPAGGWKVSGGDSEEAYLAEEIARAAFRLVPSDFAPADRAKEMSPAGRVTLTAGSAASVDLELYARGEEYWVKTPLTRGLYAHVSTVSGRRIADAIAQLTAGSD
ncbi:MAG TPA: DUF4340 domain-containing protein [Kofleriaceae bacterium]